MKKTLVMKIMSGAVCAAVAIAGAVNVAATEANIQIAAESHAYAAAADTEGLAVNSDALVPAETEEAEEKDGAGTTEAVVAKKARAGEAEEAGEAQEAEETKEAEKAEEAGEAEGTARTAQTNQTAQDAPATQNTQSGQNAQSSQNVQSGRNTQTSQNAQSSQNAQTSQNIQTSQNTQTSWNAQTAQPTQSAPQYCGHCNAVFYSESEAVAHVLAAHSTPAPTPAPTPTYPTTYVCGVCGTNYYDLDKATACMATHTAPAPAPAEPEPAPAPQTKWVSYDVCACGFLSYDPDEMDDHMYEHLMRGEKGFGYTTRSREVPID